MPSDPDLDVINKLIKLNHLRTQGEWVIDDASGGIFSTTPKSDESVGDFDLNFADEEFVLNLVNNATEVLHLARWAIIEKKRSKNRELERARNRYYARRPKDDK